MRVGLIGCGAVGVKRAAALGAASHEIAVVADPDAARAALLAERHGACHATDWRQAIDRRLDAVIVATPPHCHAEIACAALDAGAHVLVEKPAGRSAAEARLIAAAARRAGRVAKIGFNHRFHPAIWAARQLLATAPFGRPLFMRATYGHGGRPGYEREWRFDPAVSGGGEAVDQGSHLIDLARWFLGDLTLAFAATPRYFWSGAVEDNCFLALRGDAGEMAWLHASWTEWKNGFRADLAFETGTVVIEGLGGSYGVERLTAHAMLPEMGPPVTETIEFPGPDRSWELECADFARSIEGDASAIADIEDAVAVFDIVGAAYAQDRS